MDFLRGESGSAKSMSIRGMNSEWYRVRRNSLSSLLEETRDFFLFVQMDERLAFTGLLRTVG